MQPLSFVSAFMTMNVTPLLLILCFSALLYDASYAMVSDGVTLLSLLTHWTFVPPSINSSWNASDSIPCSWVGVQCDRAHNVVTLNLTDHGILGQLGPEIGQLYHLQTLVLLRNGFSGKVPSELSNCSLLEYLDLSENSFSGQIPYSLKKLQNLSYMSLSSNLLTGEIPDSLFQIPHLEVVNLHNNLLSGPIPTNIGNLTELLRLYLYGNQLAGTIPPSIGNCVRLEALFLSKNHLSGKIPPQIGVCRSLKMLHLYSNQLEGEIPDKLGMLSELEDLELSFNRLTGEIPVSIWRIQSLKHILVHNNSLFGELPLEMTNLKHLENISLFDNQFSGVIPQSLGINSSLVMLDFSNNKFTGKIPPDLCFGKQLNVLNMGLNQLQGGIPADVGRCSTLRRLILRENNFNGSLTDFETNPNLKYMDLSNNNISGPVPSSLENCSNLTEINLSMNKFTGLMPSELGKLANLVILDLAHNKLEGPLPPQLSNCTIMDRFDVGFNFLNGSFPSSLSSWTGITTLILRENHFTGGIPGFLSEFNKLRELQLGGNLLGGKIPQSIGTLQKLFYGLNLSANGLTGDIPLEFGKLKELQNLDVSLNNLTGRIDVLVDLLSLVEVNISYNFFDGPVPNHLIKLLKSSSSSFMGNPLLCVSCSPSPSLSCTKTSYLKPCVYKSNDRVGISKFSIVIIELGSSIFVSAMLLVLIHMYLLRRSKQELNAADEDQSSKSFIEHEDGIIGSIHEKGFYIYSEDQPSLSQLVMRATESLNDQYIIGRGAHGIVYKAQLDQLLVFAVKKVDFGRNKKKRLRIMLKEIQSIGMIKHRNLITYVDYWIGKDYGLILYEYMENGSLHDILHEKSPPTMLEWNLRLKIAIGIAHGLAYLHYDCVPPVMHRDIKPKNILLDADMEPRIADFSIAMRTDLYEHSNSDCQHRRMLSAYVAGTPGYMAPENAYVVVPSGKSDVYSYGVVLLELITRKKAIVPSSKDEEEEQVTTLVSWARSVWVETAKIENIVDSDLLSEFLNSVAVVNQVTEVLMLALRCTEKDRSQRPTMKEVIDFYYDMQKSVNGCRHAGASGVNQSKTPTHQPMKHAASAPQAPWKSAVPAPRPKAVHKSDAILGKPFENVEEFYTLGNVLGKGHQAVTYLCTENSTGLQYACKFISKKKLTRKDEQEDIKREIQILHHLKGQPNIVQFKGAYEDKYSVHVVMELCVGGELFDRIVARGHYSERAAALIFKQIVKIVQTCHFMGVMHRDLKPENLLLSSKDEEALLKAADFGFSNFIEEGKILIYSLVNQDIVGSPYYVAPEVLGRRSGKESDIWSAGVILYMLLSGVPPFWADDEQEIFKAILQGDIDFVSHPWPSISNNAKDLVCKMLTQDPKKRITSAEVLAHPWMIDGNAPDNPIDGAVLSRMKQFRAMSKLKKSALMNPNRGGEALLVVAINDGRE